MAVILTREDEERWLDGEEVPIEPAASDPLRSYPVSTAVNSPRKDGPDLVRALEES